MNREDAPIIILNTANYAIMAIVAIGTFFLTRYILTAIDTISAARGITVSLAIALLCGLLWWMTGHRFIQGITMQ